jgi:hypothetical protein
MVEPFFIAKRVYCYMKAKSKHMKPWNKLTQEERVARVNSLVGKYAGLTGGTEEFLREKRAETEREERRYQEEHPNR